MAEDAHTELAFRNTATLAVNKCKWYSAALPLGPCVTWQSRSVCAHVYMKSLRPLTPIRIQAL
jgi:hypothetical protein